MKAVVVALSLTLATPAFAQTPAEGPDTTKRRLLSTLQDARVAYEKQDYETAIVHFEKAFALKPIPAIQYRLAVCHEQLGQYELAREAYEHYLILEPQTKRRDQVEEALARIRAQVDDADDPEANEETVATLTVQSDPAGAKVSLNEEFAVIGTTPVTITPPTGSIELIFRLDGYETKRRSLVIEPKSKAFVEVWLRPVDGDAEAELSAQAPAPEPEEGTSGLRTAGTVATLTGVGLLATSVVGWVLYGSAVGELSDIDSSRAQFARSAADEAATRANNRLSWSVGISVSGALLLTTGLTMRWLGRPGK